MPGYSKQPKILRQGTLLLALWLPFLSFSRAEKNELEDRIEAAIQNPAVRDYFRTRLTDISTVIHSIGRQRLVLSSPLEEQVDRIARIFLKKVVRDLKTVESSFQITQEHRLDVQGSPAGPARGLQLKAWRASLRELSEAVKNLRGTVRPVLVAAYRKSMKKGASYLIDLRSSEGLRRGLDHLEKDVETALGRMRGFFFETSHTVTLSTLTDNDLLIVLERIGGLAKDLANHI